MSSKFRILLAQMCSSNSHQSNIDSLHKLAEQASTEQCDMLCLPEAAGLMNQDSQSAKAIVVDEKEDPFVQACCELAKKHSIWIHNGSTPVLGDKQQFFNRTHLISASGDICARYDKIHLFDIFLPDGKQRLESKRYGAGKTAVLATTPWASMGLSICYDLRFPSLYQDYAKAGAKVLFVPSAFTQRTGRAHWETLLRARAIENSCFVIASAQVGKHDDGRTTYGHSIVVDPWGTVLCDLGESVGSLAIDLDLSVVGTVRQQIPNLSHSRTYSMTTIQINGNKQ